ncbi:MAG: hypothetical protein GHHEDOFH_01260 [Pseudorhodoplanes sp.]|nr:hypothetical protein [Pseudorhodoplanes sp.]
MNRRKNYRFASLVRTSMLKLINILNPKRDLGAGEMRNGHACLQMNKTTKTPLDFLWGFARHLRPVVRPGYLQENLFIATARRQTQYDILHVKIPLP